MYTLRIKGSIIYKGEPDRNHGLFDENYNVIKAQLYGSKFKSNLYLFYNCHCLSEISSSFFQHKSDLTSVKKLFAYSGSLKEVPEGLFDPLTNLMDASSAFLMCYNLKKLPSKLFVNCPHVQKVDETFWGTKLSEIPDDIFDGLDELIYARGAFKYTPITHIPDDIFSNKRRLMDLSECFFECKQLESIPPTLLKGCSNLRSANAMFGRCMSDKLTSVPEGLFDDCVNL